MAVSQNNQDTTGNQTNNMTGSVLKQAILPTYQGSFQLDQKSKQSLPNKKWIHLALILIPLGLLITIIIFIWGYSAGQPQTTENEEQSSQITEQNLILTSPVPNASPPTVSTINSEGSRELLRNYFISVSNNYDEKFLDQTPELAVKSYKDYVAASGESKLEAARAFYIYLNNPNINKSDPIYIAFLKDVKADLEIGIGGKLY